MITLQTSARWAKLHIPPSLTHCFTFLFEVLEIFGKLITDVGRHVLSNKLTLACIVTQLIQDLLERRVIAEPTPAVRGNIWKVGNTSEKQNPSNCILWLTTVSKEYVLIKTPAGWSTPCPPLWYSNSCKGIPSQVQYWAYHLCSQNPFSLVNNLSYTKNETEIILRSMFV